MATTTAAGTTLAISAASPATFDATGYNALAWTVIGQVEKLGALGAVPNKIEFQPLNGPRQKHKGSVDFGSLQPTVANDDADAGQTLARTAADSNSLYSFRVTYPDGAKRYFQGRVFGWPESVDGADNLVMANPVIEINTVVVKVP